jgi:CheY-like chemotaxis protein
VIVLVADDDEDVRFVVSALLERSGCEVTTVADAHAALDVLSSTRFDVLVLDERMPPGSGSEVIRTLREAGDTTPAVLFTGFAPPSGIESDERTLVLDKADVKRLPGVVAQLADVR